MSSKDVDFKIVDLILSSGSLLKDSRNDPVFHDCVHELSALPMHRLSSEPSYLRDCHRRIIEENYKLAYDNYSTFIQTADCTKLIFKDFEIVENKNEVLLTKIPNFVDSCNNFVEKCRKSISMANMNSSTLKNHNQILEILEIPQLLEACIRNNYLDEALEVIAHTRKLERRHQNIGIIMEVAQESRLAAQKLLDQLFQQLGGNLQLPVCLKIVGYLRRMDCLPDSLLRMKFLQCRDNYLKNLLRSLPNNDAFFHATKYMEITRVNLFDIATQYRAVFNDDDLYVTNSETDGCHQGMLFSSWLVMRVRNFMVTLAEDLAVIVQNSVDYNHSNQIQPSSKTSSQSIGSKLHSLLGQAMYFGLSLSRIGSDFRGLLMPIFYNAIIKYINLRLCEIPDSFSDCISLYKWTINVDEEAISSINVAIQTNDELLCSQKYDEIIAPNRLMNHPLLAMLINQMLSILEDIRLCCPRVLKERISLSFSNTVDEIMNCLVKFYQEEISNFSTKEQKLFLTMISVFVCIFLPHINLCLTVLFADSSDTSNSLLSNQKPALDIIKLSNNFQTILPESFYSPEFDNEDLVETLANCDSNTEVSSISHHRSRVSSQISNSSDKNMIYEAPAQSDKNMIHEAPAQSEKNMIHEVPAQSDKSMIHEAPAQSEKNMIHEAPAQSEKNMIHEAPAQSDKSMIHEAPAQSEKNMIHEVPAQNDKNMIHEVPTQSEKNMIHEVPTQSEKNMIHEAPAQSDKNMIHEAPAQSEKNIIHEVPAQSEKNMIHEAPDQSDKNVDIDVTTQNETKSHTDMDNVEIDLLRNDDPEFATMKSDEIGTRQMSSCENQNEISDTNNGFRGLEDADKSIDINSRVSEQVTNNVAHRPIIEEYDENNDHDHDEDLPRHN